MKIRRKLSTCQNCGYMLDRNFNYCPECGQENDDKNVSFGIVFNTFLDTFFALDSSFFRTFKPFLIKPGFLTLQFVSGKRKSYANPIRLYLIISIFYFFTIGIMGRHMVESNTGYEINSVEATDSLITHYSEILQTDTITDKGKKKLLKKSFKKMSVEDQFKVIDQLGDEETKQLYDLGIVDYSSFGKEYSNPTKYTSDSAHMAKMARDTTAFIFNRINNQLIKDLDYRGDYSDQQILDSMQLGKLKWWEQYIAIQMIRVERNGSEAVTDYIIQNLPLMMLIVIPIFAMVLKLVYIRRKTLYVQHLIHGLHLHSFAYLFYGLANLVLIYLVDDDSLGALLSFGAFVGVSTYAYVSFLKVYRQGWFKTLIKFNLVGWIYLFMIFIFFTIEAVISFLLY